MTQAENHAKGRHNDDRADRSPIPGSMAIPMRGKRTLISAFYAIGGRHKRLNGTLRISNMGNGENGRD
ncbi:MAG TPA: hypothetical protein VL202_04600 [Pararhizobium sp.]|nr:hypothetical protein [Pararhizobium sp.]